MGRRILVVDDERAILFAIRRLLRNTHEVVVATDAGQALDILERDSRFDVVLVDVMMPQRTGMDLYEAVRVHHPGLEERIVFMSGGACTPREQAFLARVPNRRIEKPFDIRELVATIEASSRGAA